MFRNLIVTLFFLFPFASHADTDCQFPEPMCNAQAAFDTADLELTQTIKRITDAINTDAFDDYMVDKTEILTSFDASQTAWASYRDAQCDAVFRLMSGGTSRNIDQLDCMTDLTTARIKQLTSLYDVP